MFMAQTAAVYFAKHKTDIKFEISAPDLPRTHKMMSNLAAVRWKLETRKHATGTVPLVLYLKQYIFRTKNLH